MQMIRIRAKRPFFANATTKVQAGEVVELAPLVALEVLGSSRGELVDGETFAELAEANRRELTRQHQAARRVGAVR